MGLLRLSRLSVFFGQCWDCALGRSVLLKSRHIPIHLGEATHDDGTIQCREISISSPFHARASHACLVDS
jgi:hypothetical protein